MVSYGSFMPPAPPASDPMTRSARQRGAVEHVTSKEAAEERERQHAEARTELYGRCERRTGKIPAALVVEQIIAVAGDADWPVMREALAAVLRRLSFARRDQLRVSVRPVDRAVLGAYETRRSRASSRPYTIVLESFEPLRASCNCPDFVRNSLGICKHVLTVLEDIASKPRRLARAQKESLAASPPAAGRLTWQPVRPLTGASSRLEQIVWTGGRHDARRAKSVEAARHWFRVVDDDLLLRTGSLAPEKRRELLRMLNSLARLAVPGSTLPPDPALLAVLASEKEICERTEHLGVDRRSLAGALRTLERKLYSYQREGVERFLANGRLLLADDMGLGKTAQAIASCHVLFKLGRIKRGLLVVPASLKPQWEREWSRFSDTPIAIVDGTPDDRAAIYASTRRGFLIVNYEQVIRDIEQMRTWNPGVVVLDEAQRIKNWATKTAMCVKQLAPPYRLVLTGTPLENRLDELASIFDWVDDFALEPKWRLGPWHTIHADGGKESIGARNLDTLRERVAPSLLRRIRREVLDQLPPRTDTRVPVLMSDAQVAAHAELSPHIARLIRTAKRRPLTQAEFLRLMQLLTTQRIISNGMVQLDFEETWPEISHRRPTEPLLKSLNAPKLSELRDLALKLIVEQGRRIVVFSQWRRMLQLAAWAISDILEEAGVRAVYFTGKEGPKRRTHNIVDFHDDPDARVLFASDAGGVGLNLQHAANCCINLELPWNPAVLEQRIGRIYRIGQKDPIDVFNLVAGPGIESRIEDVVSSKRALFDGLFDGSSDSVEFERSASFVSRVATITGNDEDATPARATTHIESDDEPEEELDDDPGTTAVENELDALIARADEDEEPGAAAEGEPASREAILDIDAEQHHTHSKVADSRNTNAPTTTAPLSQPNVGELLSKLKIEPRADGGVRIDAPAEAASTLGALFATMARLMDEASSAATDDQPKAE